nr:MAG TPA: hypothetical protein [Caudoviricetes sp.]
MGLFGEVQGLFIDGLKNLRQSFPAVFSGGQSWIPREGNGHGLCRIQSKLLVMAHIITSFHLLAGSSDRPTR